MTSPRHLVSIDDFSREEIQELFHHADRFAADMRGFADLCPGTISASLFYEPSTRTRLSFESAMLRLGGGVITSADENVSSASKGESLADTIRVVGGAYSDLVVLRHPSEGSARLAAQFSPVPVINAGDGAHEHPTQTLCDLYNLHVERGRIAGLDVVLAGDLKYSRTVHSFAYALARFGANIVCVPQPGFEMPDYVIQRLKREYDVEPVRADARRLGQLAANSDAIYLTPQKPHQLVLFTDAKGWEVEHVDAVYMTRPQTERHQGGEGPEVDYPRLEKRSMSAESLRDAVVMHPLPRRDEISSEIDNDPRSIYFKQAARGVPIRMAIHGAAARAPHVHAGFANTPARPLRLLLARAGLRAGRLLVDRSLPRARLHGPAQGAPGPPGVPSRRGGRSQPGIPAHGGGAGRRSGLGPGVAQGGAQGWVPGREEPHRGPPGCDFAHVAAGDRARQRTSAQVRALQAWLVFVPSPL